MLPNDFVTRAEFVKIIAGVAGADVTSAAGSSFSDVDAGAWYAPYVAWAAENDIVTGSGDKFNPNSRITRQDMAVIIDRYVEKLAPKSWRMSMIKWISRIIHPFLLMRQMR